MVATYIDRIELNYLNLPLIWRSHNKLINHFWKVPCKIGLEKQNGVTYIDRIELSYLNLSLIWRSHYKMIDNFRKFLCKIGLEKQNGCHIH